MALFATRSQFGALDRHSAGRFDLLHAQMDTFRERFEQMDKRFDIVDQRLNAVAQHLEQRLSETARQIEQRLTVRLGSFLAVATAVTATLVVLLRGGPVG